MAKTVFLLIQDIQGEKDYSTYLSLTGLCLDNEEELNVSKFTLDRWGWKKPFKKDNIEIRKMTAHSTNEVRKYYEKTPNAEEF